ncbi:MAG TPA: histidine ammonia-lyase [Candidatus Binatia bacterium]|nr:histidine ammonia-lyase [Candidatus Binatia bacterium]
MQALHINGNDLTLDDLRQVVYERRPVLLQPEARLAVARARAVVEDVVENERVAYGVNTGVGQLAEMRIPRKDISRLQLNLLRSHAAGVGEPLAEDITRAMLLLRANSLAKGFSGVRPAVIDTLCEMLNRGIHPIIPSRGSVGASGDLAPLAHLALAMIGEGDVVHEGKLMTAAQAMKRDDMKPLVLEAKEAISLINGTQGMLAVGLLAILQAEVLADTADVVGALTLDALKGTDVAFDERIHKARPHAGQLLVARNLCRMLEGSLIRESHRECQKVQDAYSLRCMPQVHGAVRDTLVHCRDVFEIEMNSAVDNPLVFTEQPRPGAPRHGIGATAPGVILSGGNFHGEPLAFVLDFLAIAVSALAGISERRLERLVNPSLNEGLPAFLAPGAGLNSGFMLLQVTAAALVNENKVLSHPASVDSITTSGNREDYVSMGMTSANKLLRVVANARNVLAIEALAAAQAHDFRAPLRTGKRGQAALAVIRADSPAVTEDRALAPEIAKVAAAIAAGKLAQTLR